MNYRLIFRSLGSIANIIGLSMTFSLPWAFSWTGGNWEVEKDGFCGLFISMLICFSVGGLFLFLSRKEPRKLPLRREATAIVAFSWILATFLAALPYMLGNVHIAADRPMSVADAIFETQSGLSTTGASVISDVEDPKVIPRTILFWRHTTVFLGGLGVMILFIALLGESGNSKTLLRTERSPLANASPDVRVRQIVSALLKTYIGMNIILIFILLILGFSFFDAVCHSFSTIATGGFSTFNLSIGHFAAETNLNSAAIEWTITIFMFLGGTNLLLIYWFVLGKPYFLLKNSEWRTYIGIIVIASLLIFGFGLFHDNLQPFQSQETAAIQKELSTTGNIQFPTSPEGVPILTALRTSFFHVISLMTSTGFCTSEYDSWNARLLFVLMFVMLIGGCSGSTAGGSKVIRWIIGTKAIHSELEHAYRPSVVRPMKIDNNPLDKETTSGVYAFLMAYLITIILVTFVLLLIEPDQIWLKMEDTEERKLLDLFSASLSALSNIGPGLGVIGAQGSYGDLTSATKLILSFVMLLGRLELYVILALFTPTFWRQR